MAELPGENKQIYTITDAMWLMSDKEVIISAVDAQALKLFSLHQFERKSAIFQDDNASCHRAKRIQTILQESLNSVTWPAHRPHLHPSLSGNRKKKGS